MTSFRFLFVKKDCSLLIFFLKNIKYQFYCWKLRFESSWFMLLITLHWQHRFKRLSYIWIAKKTLVFISRWNFTKNYLNFFNCCTIFTEIKLSFVHCLHCIVVELLTYVIDHTKKVLFAIRSYWYRKNLSIVKHILTHFNHLIYPEPWSIRFRSFEAKVWTSIQR